MAVWGSLTNSCEKKRSEKQRKKERYKYLNAEFQRIAKRDKKAYKKDLHNKDNHDGVITYLECEVK